MNSGDSGSFNRLSYDTCAYEKTLYQSVEPLAYFTFGQMYENNSKCTYNGKFVRPIDNDIIDRESELRGLGRTASKCPQNDYNPDCKKSRRCTSTFDKENPVVFPGEVCPIVHSGLAKITGPGYTLKTEPFFTKTSFRQ